MKTSQKRNKMLLAAKLGIVLAFGIVVIGCRNPAGGGGGGGGAPVLDSALVAKWHSTQAAADNGTSVVFEITDDGSMTGEAFDTPVKVTTSAGRISATTTVDGQTVDGGSADYVVAGTTLEFSNASTDGGVNYFISLISGQELSLLINGDGKYHKKAGSSGGGGNNEDAFAGTWVSAGSDGTPAMKIIAGNGTFNGYLVSNNTEVQRGTYTSSGNAIVSKFTQINTALFGGADEWKAYSELSNTHKGYLGNSDTHTATITGNQFTSVGQTFIKQLNEGDVIAGTWVSEGSGGIPATKFIAGNGTFNVYLISNNKEIERGIYTVSGNSVTGKIISINMVIVGGGDEWKTYTELSSDQKNVFGGTDTYTATITGNQFTGMGQTYTKQ